LGGHADGALERPAERPLFVYSDQKSGGESITGPAGSDNFFGGDLHGPLRDNARVLRVVGDGAFCEVKDDDAAGPEVDQFPNAAFGVGRGDIVVEYPAGFDLVDEKDVGLL